MSSLRTPEKSQVQQQTESRGGGGSHTTKGRLGPVQCFLVAVGIRNHLRKSVLGLLASLAPSRVRAEVNTFLTAVGITVAYGTEHPSFLASFIVWRNLLHPVVLHCLAAFLSSD